MATGTKELKELLTLILDAISVAVDAQADGKIDLVDAALLLRLVPDLQPAIDNVGLIPSELSDLDAAEAADLVAFVMSKLTIVDAKARAVVDASLKLALGVQGLIAALKS